MPPDRAERRPRREGGAQDGHGEANVNAIVAARSIYRDNAPPYFAAGYSPVPLPPRRKAEPPRGWTGRDARMASRADVQAWTEDHPAGNIGLRLPATVIGIDSDAWKGPAELAAWQELEQKLGPLPETAPWCTSRDDGISGIRLLAVPEGYEPVGDMGAAGEIIWHGYRYVVAPPSIHPDTGKPYRWIGTGGRIPDVRDLPPLPPAWLEHLQAGRTRNGDGRKTTWTDPEIDALLEHGIQNGNQDYQLRDVVWKLRTRDTSRTQARVVWLAIVAKTPALKRGQPWTEQDFHRHWDGADQKLTHPQHPQFQQPRQRQRAPGGPLVGAYHGGVRGALVPVQVVDAAAQAREGPPGLAATQVRAGPPGRYAVPSPCA